MLGGGDRQVAGEAAAVTRHELAGVAGDGDELALAGADLDPAPGEVGVERVVVGLEADERLRGDAHERALRELRSPAPGEVEVEARPLDRYDALIPA